MASGVSLYVMCPTNSRIDYCHYESSKTYFKRVLNNYANLGDTFLENLQGLTTLKVWWSG